MGQENESGNCGGGFNRLSHRYLRRIIQSYGFGRRFTSVLMSLYAEADSSIQINGYRTRAFPIKCSVRQGCPLSRLLYAMALNPLLVSLDARLTGVSLGSHFTKFTNLTYADDATDIVSCRENVIHMVAAVEQHERATVAKINYGKSKALTVGGVGLHGDGSRYSVRRGGEDLRHQLPKDNCRLDHRDMDAVDEHDQGSGARDART